MMRRIIVKLLKLEVKKLYNHYNYKVDFNNDVTFIYGMNGCGKTTILNITEAIITGQLYKLYNYKFEKITLKYSKKGSRRNNQTITIQRNKNLLVIDFDNQKFELTNEFLRENYKRKSNYLRELYDFYFAEHLFLSKIRDTFNYVYLPLNRISLSFDFDDNLDYYSKRRLRARHFISDSEDYFEDSSMEQVEILIYKHFERINYTISKFNDNFRNDVLKSLLEVGGTGSPLDILSDMLKQKNIIKQLTDSTKSYVNILQDLKILNDTEVESYRLMFNELINTFNKNYSSENSEDTLSMLLNFKDILRIKKIVSIAEKMEEDKAIARKPLETFLNTVNEFINNDTDEKEIVLNELGRVSFKTKYNSQPTDISHLSSGEKQLVTFFANLIFGVKESGSGIFVVDEPELSLHLSWQKKFVEKTLQINNNIQLIFATHSPEIIGKNRDKMYKLEKEYIGEEV